jgi:hypothetical protein
MTRTLLLLTFFTVACGAGTPAAEQQADTDDLRAAQGAYNAYCNLCSNGEPCCLSGEDFAPERWSKQSTPYLRALRGYYECEYTESSLAETQGSNAPATAEVGFPTISNFSRNCEPHACQSYQATMQSQLDRALAAPRPHTAGAMVVCSASK